MTDLEFAMLCAMEQSTGEFVPDMSVQQNRDVIRILQSKKYITWNVLGDGYVMLGKGSTALAEERIQRKQSELNASHDISHTSPQSEDKQKSRFGQIVESAIPSAVSAVIEAISKRL